MYKELYGEMLGGRYFKHEVSEVDSPAVPGTKLINGERFFIDDTETEKISWIKERDKELAALNQNISNNQ